MKKLTPGEFLVILGLIFAVFIAIASMIFTVSSSDTHPDATPPSVSNIQPAEPLPPGTGEAEISFDMPEIMPCWLSAIESDNDQGMEATQSAEDKMATHYATVGGLSDGRTFIYNVRCVDMESDDADFEFTIEISVQAATN